MTDDMAAAMSSRLATTAADDRATMLAVAADGNGTASPDSLGMFQSIDRYVTPVWYVLGIPGNLLAYCVWTMRPPLPLLQRLAPNPSRLHAYCVWVQPKMRRSSGVYLASLALDEGLFLLMQVNFRPAKPHLYCIHSVTVT